MLRTIIFLVALTAPVLAGCVGAEQAQATSHAEPRYMTDGSSDGNWIYRDQTMKVFSSSRPGPGGTLIHHANGLANQNCVYVHGLHQATISEVYMHAEPLTGNLPGDWLLRASIAGQTGDYTARGPLPVTLQSIIERTIGGLGVSVDDRLLLEVIPVGDGPASASGVELTLAMGVKAARPDWVTFEFPETCTG